ncbi:MAG: hypothetical protein LBN05_00600 [Oscillospiraceae bacterium]|jgi:hypothetical protein|nr:hypothetical protein [Oscillospiraceae bacterium]
MKKFAKLTAALLVAVLLITSVAGLVGAATLTSVEVTHTVQGVVLDSDGGYRVSFNATVSPALNTIDVPYGSSITYEWHVTDSKGVEQTVETWETILAELKDYGFSDSMINSILKNPGLFSDLMGFDITNPAIGSAFLEPGSYKAWCVVTAGLTTVTSPVHTFTLAALPNGDKLVEAYYKYYFIEQPFWFAWRYTPESVQALDDAQKAALEQINAENFDKQTGQVNITTAELDALAAKLNNAIAGLTPRISFLEPLYQMLDKIYPVLARIFDWVTFLPLMGFAFLGGAAMGLVSYFLP